MMETALSIMGWTAFGLAIVVGLALDVVGLFGNWIILVAVGAAWALTGFEHFGIWPLAGMLVLAVLGEIIEMLAAGYGAAKFGGGRGAIIASLVGCLAGAVLGTPLFPVVGTLIGACLGAFVGAAGHELLLMRQHPSAALRTGFGAALGKVGGMVAKLGVGFIMLAIAALTY